MLIRESRSVIKYSLSRTRAFVLTLRCHTSCLRVVEGIIVGKNLRFVWCLLNVVFADVLRQNGKSHAFVMEFENVEDRDYYVEKDPVHRSFIDNLGPFVAGAQVIDFVPGVF